jgi:competence protein ComEC
VAAVAWAWAVLGGVTRLGRTVAPVIGVALLAALLAGPTRAPLRVDALAVGDGTCILVRSTGQAMLFDAGTRSNPRIDRVIVPALRRLGLVRLDAVAVSHAHIDHYGAVLAVVEAFGPCPILLTPQFLASAARDPAGADACFLAALEARGVRRDIVAAGACRQLGAARIDWLHPAPDDTFAGRNDESMLLRITTPQARLVLDGDLGPRGLADVRRRHPDLRAEIVEVPHHGSRSSDAESWLATLQPRVALQSCGPRRLEDDALFGVPLGCAHVVTARDGACAVTVHAGGAISTRPSAPARRADR